MSSSQAVEAPLTAEAQAAAFWDVNLWDRVPDRYWTSNPILDEYVNYQIIEPRRGEGHLTWWIKKYLPGGMSQRMASLACGGGHAEPTMRLRDALVASEWGKHTFVVRTIVDGTEREATSHEVDHVRRCPAGTLALEIEWNNKDPFFDRDLENFQRLHVDSAISVGIIVTRGRSLQAEMLQIMHRAATARGFTDVAALEAFVKTYSAIASVMPSAVSHRATTSTGGK